MKTSSLEATLAFQLRAEGITNYETEFAFAAPERKWRADFYFPPDLLCELEGGEYQLGRHQRPGQFSKDCEKYNAATLAGYRLIRVTGSMVHSGEALNTIKKALETA